MVRSKALSLLEALFAVGSPESSELRQVQLEALQGALPALQLVLSDEATQVSRRGDPEKA
jgi:hypothetical protein